MNSNLKSIILSFIQMDHFLDSNLIKWPEAIHQNDVGTDTWHLSCPKGEQKALTVPPLPSEPRVGPIFVNVLTAFFTPEAGRFQGRAWWEHSKILWWRSPSLVFIASLLAAWFSTLAPINPQRSSTIPGDSCQKFGHSGHLGMIPCHWFHDVRSLQFNQQVCWLYRNPSPQFHMRSHSALTNLPTIHPRLPRMKAHAHKCCNKSKKHTASLGSYPFTLFYILICPGSKDIQGMSILHPSPISTSRGLFVFQAHAEVQIMHLCGILLRQTSSVPELLGMTCATPVWTSATEKKKGRFNRTWMGISWASMSLIEHEWEYHGI